MLKRYSIIFVLMLAYSIVIGHSIIPHHHHVDDHAMKQATMGHHEDHHDNDDHESSGLGHDFENYLHAPASENSYKQPVLKIQVQQIAAAYLICNFTFRIKPDVSPPPLVRLSNEHIPVLRHSLSPKGLRAPPLA